MPIEEEIMFKTVPKLNESVLYTTEDCTIVTDENIYIDFFGDACNLVGPITGGIEPYHIPHIFQSDARIKATLTLKMLSSMGGKVFWVNSGTEAIETAIKLCRKRFRDKYEGEQAQIIYLVGGFHGRTLGALSHSSTPEHYKNGFGPFLQANHVNPANNIDYLKWLLDDVPIAGLLMECIQGGNGDVSSLPKPWVKQAVELCHHHDVPIICDEVQTGFGRTGKWFAFQHYNFLPDIICVSKGMAGGLPCGAVIANNKFDDTLDYGMHFNTLGGSPYICSIFNHVINKIMAKNLVENSIEMGNYLKKELLDITGIYQISGKGLFLSAYTTFDSRAFAKQCLENGLIICGIRPTHFKLTPPLTVNKGLINQALSKMHNAAALTRLKEKEDAGKP